jgi:hypothetical protein
MFLSRYEAVPLVPALLLIESVRLKTCLKRRNYKNKRESTRDCQLCRCLCHWRSYIRCRKNTTPPCLYSLIKNTRVVEVVVRRGGREWWGGVRGKGEVVSESSTAAPEGTPPVHSLARFRQSASRFTLQASSLKREEWHHVKQWDCSDRALHLKRIERFKPLQNFPEWSRPFFGA